MDPQSVTKLLATLTILAQIDIAFGLIGLAGNLWKKVFASRKDTFKIILLCTYIVSLFSTLGSLYFSDIAGYTPCKLCWYQRILMYPQTILYMVALAINDKKVALYGLALSIPGLILAIYHYLLQIGILETTSCSTVGFSISCSERFSTTFGYITIPLMSATAFALITVLWLIFLQVTNLKNTKK